MVKLFVAFAAAVLVAAAAPAQTVADAAVRTERYEQLHRETGNSALLWLIAEAHAEAGHEQQAIAALDRIAGRGLGFIVTPESPLSRLAGKAEFDRLAERLRSEFQIVRNAREMASIDLPNLVPEGIAADPGTQRLFIGDMAGKRILSLREKGHARVFASTGVLRPLGMTVDRSRSLLWVAATTAFVAKDKPASALLAFDVRNGRLKRSISSAAMKSINDVAVAPNGDVYMTDSVGGALFRLRRAGNSIEQVTPAGRMSYPNGVAVSGDGRSVYVAQGIALRRIDAATGEVSTVGQPPNLALLSIDGLYWYKGSLIGVQNAGSPGRVLRLKLSNDGTSISAFEVIEAGNPDFDIPTTGAISGDGLIVIANSQLTRLGDDGRVTPGPPLKPVKLLKIRLPTPAG